MLGRMAMHGRGACMAGRIHGRGACMAGECAWQGDMHGRGACMARGVYGGGHVWQGAGIVGEQAWQDMHGRRDGHCSRWYASYWNAFLLMKYCFKYLKYKLKYHIRHPFTGRTRLI